LDRQGGLIGRNFNIIGLGPSVDISKVVIILPIDSLAYPKSGFSFSTDLKTLAMPFHINPDAISNPTLFGNQNGPIIQPDTP